MITKTVFSKMQEIDKCWPKADFIGRSRPHQRLFKKTTVLFEKLERLKFILSADMLENRAMLGKKKTWEEKAGLLKTRDVSIAASESQTLIPQIKGTLEEEYSKVDFDALRKKESRFNIIIKGAAALGILSFSALVIGTGIAAVNHFRNQHNSLYETGVLIGFGSLIAGACVVCVVSLLSRYMEVDVESIQKGVQNLKRDLDRLDQKLNEILDCVSYSPR